MDEINFGQKLILAVLAVFGTVVAGLLTLIGVWGKNRNDAGAVINSNAVALINELQEERVALTNERRQFHEERSQWNAERADYRKRLLTCEGQIRGLEQYVYSLEGELRRQGINIPRRPKVDPIFVLDTPDVGNNIEGNH